jgi:DNA adenine methylase
MTITRPAMRYHGSKFRLADWILPLLPAHRCYVEPYGGAAGVLLRKPRAEVEVYNDLDGDMVNFFRVLRDAQACAELIRQLELTPYARAEFELAWQPAECPIERARRTCIRAQMGFGSAGATKQTTGFRTYTRERFGQSVQVDWVKYPAHLASVAQRMQGVLIEQRPALQVMADHDGADTLHFIDPPYMHSTRSKPRGALRTTAYRHEMTDADHAELLAAAQGLRGLVLLCGYASDLYTDTLRGWLRLDKATRAASGQSGSAPRTESLWLNPQAAEAQQQGRLIA